MAANALGALLVKVNGRSPNIGAFAFAVGSTLFCWLLLRGRMIPVTLAWLGVVASVLLMVGLPRSSPDFLAARLPRAWEHPLVSRSTLHSSA